MSTTDELLEHLRRFEGFVGHPYYCPAGYLTVGYGHRINESERQKYAHITDNEATILLTQDVAKFTLGAVKLSPVLKDTGGRRLNAIIDFCFNCGLTAYAGSTLRLRVDEQDWKAAAHEIEKWVYITDPKTKQKVKSAWQIKRRAVGAGWLLLGG
jgi:Phage-related lysozyme (muraminidase)